MNLKEVRCALSPRVHEAVGRQASTLNGPRWGCRTRWCASALYGNGVEVLRQEGHEESCKRRLVEMEVGSGALTPEFRCRMCSGFGVCGFVAQMTGACQRVDGLTDQTLHHAASHFRHTRYTFTAVVSGVILFGFLYHLSQERPASPRLLLCGIIATGAS